MFIDAYFKNGKFHGKLRAVDEYGKCFEAECKDGDLNGKYIHYYENGTIEFECIYVNGKQHGKSISYYENGYP